jgi:two-component system nitrogen regulation response regulator GlnG
MPHNSDTHLPVLLVDDEPQLLRSASLLLRSSGIRNVIALDDSRKVLPLVGGLEIGVLVLDLTMPYVSGFELLEQIASRHPDVPVIIMTASNDLETAIECMRTGALDYLLKPVEKNRLISAVKRVLEIRSLREEVFTLKEQLLSEGLHCPEAFAAIVTRDSVMHSIFKYVEAIANTSQSVLITGETGTGKELIARAIHALSGRGGKFIAENVAGLDDTMFSDTLFGHRKGAFTGADHPRPGLIAQAVEGTLFLDEIGDLKTSSQLKLLRLLQEQCYYPLGADQPKQSSARIVVATNRDIQQCVERGEFRKDLYYRLRAHHIRIPPLRERKQDIPLLIDHFIHKAALALGKHPPTYPPELERLMRNYHYPGNLRELEGMLFDAVTRNKGGMLSIQSIREAVGHEISLAEKKSLNKTGAEVMIKLSSTRLPTLKEMEHYLIDEALRRAGGNQRIAAEMLGLTRQALNKRLLRNKKMDKLSDL